MDREKKIGGAKPFKVWDFLRRTRKSLVASSLKELEYKAREKMAVSPLESVRLVLESDGTQLEDGEYFRTLPYNTVVMLLRDDEQWHPLNLDALRAALQTIPRIVCETLYALHLHEQCPSWRIMDNKGRITVVLHWDQRNRKSDTSQQPATIESIVEPSEPSTAESAADGPSPVKSPKKPQSILKDRSVSYEGTDGVTRREMLIDGHGGYSKEQQRVKFDETIKPPPMYREPLPSTSSSGAAQYAGGSPLIRVSSFENARIHQHTASCGATQRSINYRSISPHGLDEECDFHCCVLQHADEHMSTATPTITTRSAATSPIPQLQQQQQYHYLYQMQKQQQQAVDRAKKIGARRKNVRFIDQVEEMQISEDESTINGEGRIGWVSAVGLSEKERNAKLIFTLEKEEDGVAIAEEEDEEDKDEEEEEDSSETDTEEVVTEKFLILVDEAKHHLTIKDIGVILEGLNTKIVDVKRLDREYDSNNCQNWMIQAAVRGENLDELGLIYSGRYYAIFEHPGYKDDGTVNTKSQQGKRTASTTTEGVGLVQDIEAHL